MAYSIRLPDGTLVENIPDDVDPSAAKQKILSAYPDIGKQPETPADTRRPEDVGILESLGAATKKGFEGLGDIASGLGLAGTSVFGTKEETAKKMADIKAEQAEQAKGTPTLTAADIQRIAEERGLVKAGTQVPSYIAEQILQSAPQMALPLAVGAAATPFLTPIGGAIAGIATYGVQQFGNFLVRQAQEKKDPEELEVAKAAITAAGTAPIGYFADRFTAGLGSIGTKKAMSEIYSELGKRGVMKEIGGRAAKGAGVGIIAEAPTEVLEQVAERYQAGLDLSDQEAMNEYKEAFFGAAAAGAGIGGGAKAVGGYGEYRQAKAAEAALEGTRSAKTAFDEAGEEDAGTGIDRGLNQQGLPISDQQELEGLTAGTRAVGLGDLEGDQLSASAAGSRESAINDQLARLRQQQAEYAAFDEADPRIQELEDTIKDLQSEIKAFNAPGTPWSQRETPSQFGRESTLTTMYNRMRDAYDASFSPDDAFAAAYAKATKPEQAILRQLKNEGMLGFDYPHQAISAILEEPAAFDLSSQLKTSISRLGNKFAGEAFNAPGQQAGFEFGAADETTQRAIDTEKMTETPAFELQAEQGALPTGDVTKIEEAPEAPKAKMMLIGEGANPLAPIKSFLNSLKSASVAPMELKKFKAELGNLMEDIAEFLGQSTKKVSRYAEEGMPSPGEGPDVSVPLDPQQRAMRLNFLDNFFNQFSAVGPDKEAATSALSQRMAGMDAATQANVLSQLTSLPALNTRRGVEELRAKLKDALAQFEGVQIQEPVEKAAIITEDKQAGTLAKRAINLLKNIPEKLRTPEEKAAANYFGRWSFSMALRSAAFDLGSKPNALFTGPIFKNQNKSQAELFQKWVEENLSAEDVASFNATVEDYKRQTEKAEQYEKQAEEMQKMGGAARRYGQIVGRAPTGKVSEGFQKEAGLGKFKKPSAVSKLEASRFYPMHPAIQQAIAEGNLDAALSILERSGNKFHAGLAAKLRSLGLQTAVVFDRQNVLAAQILDARVSEQRNDVFNLVQAAAPELFAQHFTDPNNFKSIREGLNKITDPAVEAQVAQLKDAYDAAIAMVESSGTYVQGLDVVNLNREMGGASNYTFIHELVHAATLYSLDEVNADKLSPAQRKAVAELTNLYEFAKRTGLKEYGFTNVQEFVAEAFSNETFQDILKGIPYQGEANQSLWDKFTALVAKIFGMDNVLGYTLANANVIMQAPSALTAPVAAYNAKAKGSIIAGDVPTAPAFRKFLDRAFDGKPSWEKVKGNMPYVIQNMSDTFRKHALKGLTLRQLNDLVGNRISQFRAFISTAEEMMDESNRILYEVKGVSDEWRVFQNKEPAKAKLLSKLMLDATRLGINPNTQKGSSLDAAWNEIGPAGQAIFNKVEKFYKERMKAYIESVVEAKKSTHRTTFDKESALYKQESKDIESQPDIQSLRAYFKRHTMPVYFPIRRFGEYSLQIGRSDNPNREFYLFENAAQRNEFSRQRLQELADKGTPVSEQEVYHRNSLNDLTSENLKDFQFYKELQDIIDSGKGYTNSELKQNIKDKVEQMYFMLLPDQSIRKAMMNRQNIAGMSEDMLRAFESSATHIAYQHARFKYAPELHNLIDLAAKDVREKGLEGTVDSDYVKEFRERLKIFMNPPEAGSFTTAASNLSFLWYMSAPASALVNMLGVPAIGLPVLAAKYNWGASSAKVAEYVKKFASTGFKDQLGEPAFPSLSNKPSVLNELQLRAFNKLVADGLFDLTLTHDILDKANRPSDLDQGIFQRTMRIVGSPFHAAEKFNREVLGMATFDLAYADLKKQGYTDEAAFKKAIDITKDLTYKSMFDYSTLNKPRFLQNQYAKVILQFKQFSQQMTYLLARSAYEGIGKKYSPEELDDIRSQIRGDRTVNKPGLPPLTDAELEAAVQDYIKGVKTEARNRLAGTLGMTFVFAGATGLPLWSVLSMTMNALQAVFGEEDDETWDFDNWFKNWSAKTFGGFVGDSVSRGLASQVIGADLSSRMGLNDLWYREPRKSSDEVTFMQNLVIQLMGPSMGLVINTAEAVKQLNDGHLERAMETASPAVIKNIMKGMRYTVEGRAVNLKGDELVGDVSGYESIIQGLGFSPERIAQRQKSNIEMKTAEQKMLSKRTALMDAFFLAVDNDDDDLMDRVMDKIDKFNGSKGVLPLTGAQLQKSVKTRYKNRALAESTGGISINKKLIADYEDMQAYGNPED